MSTSLAGPPFRLDPELAAISVLIPTFNFDDVPGSRDLELQLVTQDRTPVPGVSVENGQVRGRDGSAIEIRIYRPLAPATLPAMLYVHGGAFMLGSMETEDDRCAYYARDAHCVIVAANYRLAPEHPFPAGYEDCVDVLRWMSEEASALSIDARRLGIGGNSAGGTIAAAIALDSRGDSVPSLVHQLLINPVLDCRSDTHSMRELTGAPVWSRELNVMMWGVYLGGWTGPVDYRASPSLADDLTKAPAASVWIAEFDPLRDESHDYARRLMEAGVSVGITQYPGTFHGFDGYRMTGLGRRALQDQVAALRWALHR